MTTKRFMKLQIIFILLFAVTIISNTFAWAPRPVWQGGAHMSSVHLEEAADTDKEDLSKFTAIRLVTSDNTYYVNGSECTVETYTGTYDATEDRIIYGDDENVEYQSSPITTFKKNYIPQGTKYYFKSIITNNNPKVPTNVSLFIDGELESDYDGKLILTVSSPVLREEFFPDIAQSGVDTFEFLPLVRNFEVPAGGTVNVEWNIINIHDTETGVLDIKRILMTTN